MSSQAPVALMCPSVGVSPTEYLVFVALSSYANQDGQCWPSIRTLKAEIHVTDRTLRKAFTKFEALGLIVRKFGTSSESTLYTVLCSPAEVYRRFFPRLPRNRSRLPQDRGASPSGPPCVSPRDTEVRSNEVRTIEVIACNGKKAPPKQLHLLPKPKPTLDGILDELLPLYSWLDRRKITADIRSWSLRHPHRQITSRFVGNWLKREDVPLKLTPAVRSDGLDPSKRPW